MELITLHRYWIWANRSREHLDVILAAGELPADADGWFASDVGLFLTRWYAALFVVVEGWRKLGLADPTVDQLLQSPLVDKLRRCRNGVCHFQRNYLDDRFTDFFSDMDSVSWVRELNLAFGRYFLTTLKRRRRP